MAPPRHRGRSRPPSRVVHPRPERRRQKDGRTSGSVTRGRKAKKHGRDAGAHVRRKGPAPETIGKWIYRRDDLGRFAPGRRRLARPAKPAKPAKKIPRRASAKPIKKVPSRAPAKPAKKVPSRAPAKPAKKVPSKKPAKPVKKVPSRAPAKPPKKVPSKKPAEPEKPKKRRKRRPKGPIPILSELSKQADTEMQVKLVWILEYIEQMFPGMDMAIKTFINADGTVDGELRIGNLVPDWQGEDGSGWMVAALSEMFRAFPLFDKEPAMGGRFWISFGVRFGPQNDADLGELAELYKRFRGMFQTGSYPSPADDPVRLQLALVGLKTIMDGVMREHGLSHAVALIRFIWTFKEDKKKRIEQPGRYKDEMGSRE